MKEIAGCTCNELLNPAPDGKVEGMAEVILVLSEPQYHFDASGTMVKSRTTEPFRFVTSAKGLRALVARFTEYADAIEKVAGAINDAVADQEPSDDEPNR